jgi:3-hydroxyisobutyrate dehydrogenase-like beta-hydroxyacid dehydrogenase
MARTNPKTYESCTPTKVAFIGLGVMGYPMAGHSALAGHHVTVYNRKPAKAKDWCAEFPGHASAATPREAALGADMVFCCVGNDNDLRAVMLGADGALAGTQAGALLIDHTTASANVARELFAAAKAKGVHFVDAPSLVAKPVPSTACSPSCAVASLRLLTAPSLWAWPSPKPLP